MGNSKTALGEQQVVMLRLFITPNVEEQQLANASRVRVDWRGWLGAGMVLAAGILIWRSR